MTLILKKSLYKRLTDASKPSIAECDNILRVKANGKCALCNGGLGSDADCEIDHIDPLENGGPDELENFQIVHKSCNKFKKQNKDSLVVPYLEFRRELRDLQSDCLFDQWQSLPSVAIKPKAAKLTRPGSKVKIDFGSKHGTTEAYLHSEKVDGRDCPFVFIDLPLESIFHDDKCQPRTIKETQVWKVYKDLHVNPLHEPPACRIVTASGGKTKFLLFDGQHKTIASHLHSRKSVVTKIYLELTVEQTKELVISIQATVTKLPLSAMETMAKMGAVWVDKFQVYAKSAGSNASEQGFINNLSAGDRSAAKKKLKEALLSEVYDECHELKVLVEANEVTEKQAKTRIIEPLVYLKPLEELLGEKGQLFRDQERTQLGWLVNEMTKELIKMPTGNLTETEKGGVNRRRYGSSLRQISVLLRESVRHLKSLDTSELTLGHKQWTKKDKSEIKKMIKKIKSHGIWKHPATVKNVIEFENAASKNQEMGKVFARIGLKVGYAIGADQLAADWAGRQI